MAKDRALQGKRAYKSVKDALSGRKDANSYSLKLQEGDSYTFSAANLQPGENLRLKLVDVNGSVLASADDSLGSEDPILRYSASEATTARLVVQTQEDIDNRGRVPYRLAVSNDSVELAAENNESEQPDSALDSPLDVLKRLARDGITLHDLDRIFASATSDDGIVDKDEFSTLNFVGNNLHRYVDDPVLADYYSYVFSSAVGVNPANKFWTGGVQDRSDRIRVGNLEIGSKKQQVDLLRSKWFKGKDLPLGRIDGDAANGIRPRMFGYQEASGPLFSGDIDFDQVAQGDAGTCYFLASLMSVASSDSDLIESMFVDNGDGTFGVRFFGIGGNKAWVTVNRDLPIANSGLLMAGSYRALDGYKSPETNLIWAAIAEKALAQVNETGILRRANSENSYQAVEGGYSEGLDYITGLTSRVAINEAPLAEIGFDEVIASLDSGKPVLLSSFTVLKSPSGQTNLVDGHAYSVIDFDQLSNSFIVANPWGAEDQGTSPNSPFQPIFAIPKSTMSSLYDNKLVYFGVG